MFQNPLAPKLGAFQAGRQDVSIAIEVDQLGSVVVLFTDEHRVFVPSAADTVEVFVHESPGGGGYVEVVFAGNDVEVAVAVDIGHVKALRTDEAVD